MARLDSTTDARADWIVNEFLVHLEEEGLYMPNQLSTEQVEQLQRHDEANATFAALVDETGKRIQAWAESGALPAGDSDAWPKRGAHGWTGFWRTYADGVYAGERAWFEWNFATPAGGDQPRFGAGIAFVEGKELPDEMWERLMAEGLTRSPTGDRWPRAFIYIDPESVAEQGDGTLTGQAGELAESMINAFRATRRALALPEHVP